MKPSSHLNDRPRGIEVVQSNACACIYAASWAGIFVAGSLAMSQVMRLSLPCGPSDSCAVLNLHPASKVLGIPLSVIGLVYYGMNVVMCYLVSLRGVRQSVLAITKSCSLLAAFAAVWLIAR